jgi:hypothetical protein
MYSAIENDLKTLLPNVKLMVNYQGNDDYFDALKKGNMNEPFEKMTAMTANNPSSWRCVSLKNRQKNQQLDDSQVNGMIHGDFTDNGGIEQC